MYQSSFLHPTLIAVSARQNMNAKAGVRNVQAHACCGDECHSMLSLDIEMKQIIAGFAQLCCTQ